MVAAYLDEVIQQTSGKRTRADDEEHEVLVEKEKEEEDEEEEEAPTHQPPTARVAESVLQLENIRERMDPRLMFQKFVEQAYRSQNDIVSRLPRVQNLIPLMGQVEDGDSEAGSWDRLFTAHAIDRGIELPILEVITPEYVSDFLREPDPLKSWERPCCTPFKTCESVDMGGPVLREFLLPSQTKTLLQSPYFSSRGTLASVVLPPMRRSCFLCSQRLVYKEWAKQKVACKDAPGAADHYLVHDYIMAVNCPGGYDMRLILPGFTEWIGLAGPVIQHVRSHYAPTRFENNRRGWTQKQEMLFQHGAMR
jgi:hypothetical protein